MHKVNSLWKSQSQSRDSARTACGSKQELDKRKKNPSKIMGLEVRHFSESSWICDSEGLAWIIILRNSPTF